MHVQEKDKQQSAELEQMKALTDMRMEVEAYQRKEKERKDMLERLAKAKAQQEKRQVHASIHPSIHDCMTASMAA